jgi:hypothetical protein
VVARGPELRQRRRVGLQIAVGEHAGADEEGRAPFDAAGDRADRDLRRHAEACEGALLQHLGEAPVLHVGDEHARRVRADVDTGANHRHGKR